MIWMKYGKQNMSCLLKRQVIAGGYLGRGGLPCNVNIKETALQQDLCHGHQALFSLGITALEPQLTQALTEQIKEIFIY